ncbi:MAG: AarF/ABC1/UbiB kinase family protein, partial [Candidatus Sericytochromatia bacterium]|nr:AarF/ABC1/UbiB kinase family protein [Candidatus Tanganyikabacteria bacterium]
MEILTYDPPANAARLRRHPGLALRRTWQILWTFAWFWVRHWIAHQNWLPHSKSALEREIATARYLTNCLVALGPTFIKMGQAMSTRPDVLPRTYIQEFTKLQDKVPAFDTKIAIATIERELGKSIDQAYPSFDPQPISAASIGQVYKARTREGDRVAVKVQRPNLPWILSIDLAILRLFAAYAEWRNKLLSRRSARLRSASGPADSRTAFDLFVKDMPYVAITDQFGKSLFDQTDFLLEGRNAE